MLLALSAELIPLVTLSAVLHGGMNTEQGVDHVHLGGDGIGLGLIGSFLRSTPVRRERPADAVPRTRRRLLRELIDLSGGLSSGLDPVTLGAAIAGRVRDELPVTALAVHVPRGHDLSPLVTEPGELPDGPGRRSRCSPCETGRTGAHDARRQRVRVPADDRRRSWSRVVSGLLDRRPAPRRASGSRPG